MLAQGRNFNRVLWIHEFDAAPWRYEKPMARRNDHLVYRVVPVMFHVYYTASMPFW